MNIIRKAFCKLHSFPRSAVIQNGCQGITVERDNAVPSSQVGMFLLK
jgi:hypothetical protein